MKKNRFDYYLPGSLSPTDTITPCPCGEYIHYEIKSKYRPELSPDEIDWVSDLLSNGFVLHNSEQSEIQDIYLTSERFLCKVTCVHKYVNVQFFNSLDELNHIHQKTMELIHKIKCVNK